MSIPDKAKMDQFAAWVEKHPPPQTPRLANLWAPPVYARETLTERVEPYYSQFHELEMAHPLSWSDGHDAEPDPEWYTPTPKLLALDAELSALRAKAFREVPNPDYDPERAAAWREQQRARFSQKTHYVGQAYTPAAPDP